MRTEIKRVYHRYENLEEYHAGMWRNTPIELKDGYSEASANLMRNTAAFRSAMERVIREWPKSCEHNLTIRASNRKAWLGHAGCCIAAESPEDLTRLGWHTLSEEEQDLANEAAQQVIEMWEDTYRA